MTTLLAVAGSSLLLLAVWVGAGRGVTGHWSKPHMWPRKRRAAVILLLEEAIYAGRMSACGACEAYRKAVGAEYLFFAFSVNDRSGNYIDRFYDAELQALRLPGKRPVDLYR